MRADQPSFLRSLLQDVRWKAVALIVAVIVFYTIRSRISDTVTIAIPVEVEREPGQAVLKVEPASVQVTFRGAYADLQQLGLRDMRVLLHLKVNAAGGPERVRLRAGDVHGRPSGARVVGIDPQTVRLTSAREVLVKRVDAPRTRELRDVPVLVAAPAIRKGSWQVLPPTVQVRLTGRAAVVDAIAPQELVVLVDARGVLSDEQAVAPVLLHLPHGVVLDAATSEPAVVTVMRKEE